MSGTSSSSSLPSTAFTDAEKTDIRRFCGFEAFGQGASGFQSWRFFVTYGTLEFRMNNLAPAEYQVVRQYLAYLYTLELAVPAAGANLDTDQAAVWKHNKDEVRDRAQLFDSWCRRLCGFLGIPPGPALGAGGPGLQMVV
jgi:hypothetical protein